MRRLKNKSHIACSGAAMARKPTQFPLIIVEASRLRIGLAVKRAFDIVVAVAGLVGFSPMIVLAAALIKFGSPGPILVRQVLCGPTRKPFRSYRFRTTDGRRSRSSPIGRVLRSTGIDGLAQLINVLQGD